MVHTNGGAGPRSRVLQRGLRRRLGAHEARALIRHCPGSLAGTWPQGYWNFCAVRGCGSARTVHTGRRRDEFGGMVEFTVHSVYGTLSLVHRDPVLRRPCTSEVPARHAAAASPQGAAAGLVRDLTYS